MPGNYAQIGMIKCILPQAKIIHCRRNPLDNLLSCYKQNFAMGHEWSYDIKTLAKQYASYRNLMAYWRSILPADDSSSPGVHTSPPLCPPQHARSTLVCPSVTLIFRLHGGT